jgi:hypothetical protein
MERRVLERYFDDVTVVDEHVPESEGWARIDDLPSLRDAVGIAPE